MRQAVEELLLHLKTDTGRKPVTEGDLAGLPEPVTRYLRYTGIVGRNLIRTVHFRQRGFFRTKENGRWLPITAEQFFTTDPPGFVWHGRIKPLPFVSVTARDSFIQGKGRMLVKLMGFMPLIDARGPEIDQAALLRYFSEMAWFPTAFLSRFIQWEETGPDTARGTIRAGNISATATFRFKRTGELQLVAADRYREVGGQYELAAWEGRFGRYTEANGIRVPMEGYPVWKLPSGNFCYYRLRLASLDYDKPFRL